MENYLYSAPGKKNSTPERILIFLKMQGPQTASAVAREFGITNEGARLHLIRLADEELVKPEHVPKGVGRPATLFGLTDKEHEKMVLRAAGRARSTG